MSMDDKYPDGIKAALMKKRLSRGRTPSEGDGWHSDAMGAVHEKRPCYESTALHTI